jgi:RHS repeat-associated protein
LFSEVLSYRDATGNFRDGNITQATFAGTTLGSEQSSAYEYDENGRLTSAKANARADWNIEGITYDANGNITRITNGSVLSEYIYKPGTNQVARRKAPTGEAGYLYDANGRLTQRVLEGEEPDSKYGELARLLAAAANGDEGMWQLADKETWNILLRSTNRDKIGRWWNMPSEGDGVDLAIIANVPCTDLEGIDQLWVKYSKGKFGFSIQRGIYLESGAPKGVNEPGWRDFGKRVGWYQNDHWIMRQEVKFASSAPRGCLSVFGVFTVLSCNDWSAALTGLAGLFGRFEACPADSKYRELEQISYESFTGLTSEIHKRDIITTFSYNGLRQRVLKTTCRESDRTSRRQSLYIHGINSYPLTETNERGSVCYIYGLTGLVAMHEDNKLFFFFKDHLGSTREVLNQTNDVEAKFDYAPFGALRAANSSPKEAMARFRYLYTGQEFDLETGLYNYRSRLYESDLARFYSPDPQSEFFSPYVFVGNNPINRVDPSGMISLLGTRLLTGAVSTLVYTGIGAGLGAAIGATVGAVKGNITEHTGQGALWGAVAGASLGVLRTFAEIALIPAFREFRSAANANHPVILFNRQQTVDILGVTVDSGRVGAEMIAEGQRIPQSLWNDHLISYQQLYTRPQRFPATFNRRTIAVAHGDALGEIETKSGDYLSDNPYGFVDLINKSEPLTGIDRIDLCVCHAARNSEGHQSFARA